MNHVYDKQLEKWIVIVGSDVVLQQMFDTEEECVAFIEKEKANSAATEPAQ